MTIFDIDAEARDKVSYAITRYIYIKRIKLMSSLSYGDTIYIYDQQIMFF